MSSQSDTCTLSSVSDGNHAALEEDTVDNDSEANSSFSTSPSSLLATAALTSLSNSESDSESTYRASAVSQRLDLLRETETVAHNLGASPLEKEIIGLLKFRAKTELQVLINKGRQKARNAHEQQAAQARRKRRMEPSRNSGLDARKAKRSKPNHGISEAREELAGSHLSQIDEDTTEETHDGDEVLVRQLESQSLDRVLEVVVQIASDLTELKTTMTANVSDGNEIGEVAKTIIRNHRRKQAFAADISILAKATRVFYAVSPVFTGVNRTIRLTGQVMRILNWIQDISRTS